MYGLELLSSALEPSQCHFFSPEEVICRISVFLSEIKVPVLSGETTLSLQNSEVTHTRTHTQTSDYCNPRGQCDDETSARDQRALCSFTLQPVLACVSAHVLRLAPQCDPPTY